MLSSLRFTLQQAQAWHERRDLIKWLKPTEQAAPPFAFNSRTPVLVLGHESLPLKSGKNLRLMQVLTPVGVLWMFDVDLFPEGKK